MTEISCPIFSADSALAATAAGVIAPAFDALLASEWLVPQDDQRVPVLGRYMLLHVEDALADGGMVEMTADHTAVAVWSPVDEALPTPGADYEQRLAAACGTHAARFLALEKTFAAHHPVREPHHHLAFLAVLPGHQGDGRGSALLAHHATLYPTVPAYLEASSPGSRRLYAAHGFQDLEEFTLAEDGPTLWPMWRPASS